MRLTMEYILNKIISYYINSKDFNGYPSIKIEDNDLPLLKNLIQQNLIEIISSLINLLKLYSGKKNKNYNMKNMDFQSLAIKNNLFFQLTILD